MYKDTSMERIYMHGEDDFVVSVISISENIVHFELNGKRHKVELTGRNRYHSNGEDRTCVVSDKIVTVDGHNVDLEAWTLSRASGSDSISGDMLSPMPGKILKVCLDIGAEFKIGDPLIIMEAMKMEHTIKASVNGTLTNFLVKEGQLVEGSKELFEYEVAE